MEGAEARKHCGEATARLGANAVNWKHSRENCRTAYVRLWWSDKQMLDMDTWKSVLTLPIRVPPQRAHYVLLDDDKLIRGALRTYLGYNVESMSNRAKRSSRMSYRVLHPSFSPTKRQEWSTVRYAIFTLFRLCHFAYEAMEDWMYR